jgi:carbohydrate-selective porin OprB
VAAAAAVVVASAASAAVAVMWRIVGSWGGWRGMP